MTTPNRQSAGQPTGGQFAAKTYTEDDIKLAAKAVRTAGDAAWEAEKLAHLATARLVAVSVLSEFPTAAKIRLAESDQEGCSWDIETLFDADGNELGNASDSWELFDELTPSLWDLPKDTPTTISESGSMDDDPAFAWIKFISTGRRSGYAEFDIAKAIELTGPDPAPHVWPNGERSSFPSETTTHDPRPADQR